MPTIVPRWDLTLLGYWQLKRNDEPVDVGARQKRVITSLALLGVRPRHFIATLLWPDGSETQAAGNLRASIFRITHELPSLIRTTEPLQLEEHVAVDVYRLRQTIGALIDSPEPGVPRATIDLLRTTELLPGWYEDWVVCEQELLQHERVDALEILARRYLAEGDSCHAIVAARSAASIEPLRESLQFLLIRGYLAADNRASALSAYRDFCLRLRRELGMTPSSRFDDLLRSELSRPAPSRAASGHATALNASSR